MAAEYIIIEEKKYRVSHSFATLTMFSNLTGRKTLEQMGELNTISTEELLTMMFCALTIGEKLDGRKLEYESVQELGMVVGIGHMQDYVQIFARQMRAEIPQKKNSTEVKKKRPFWRRLRE